MLLLLLLSGSPILLQGRLLGDDIPVGVLPHALPGVEHARALTSGFFVLLAVACHVSVYMLLARPTGGWSGVLGQRMGHAGGYQK